MDAPAQTVVKLERFSDEICSNFRNIDVQGSETLKKRVVRAASNLHFTINGTGSVNRLPPELLSQIFAHLLTPWIALRSGSMWSTPNPNVPLATISLVCQYWRQTAIGAKELWTHVVAGVTDQDPQILRRMFELFLKRSGSYPLSVSILQVRGSNDVPFTLDAMEPHVRRLRRLSVDTPCTGALISQHAPVLEEFKMDATRGVGTLSRVFGGSTPRLRMLDLAGCVPWPTNRFRDLSTLALSRVKIENLDHLFFMLEDSPCLEHLYLRECLFRTLIQSNGTTLQRPAKVHSLRTLSLAQFSVEEISGLLHSLSFPQDGLAMRFEDVQTSDPKGIVYFTHAFPSGFPPGLTMFSATSFDFQVAPGFCTFHAVGQHVATAIQWRPLDDLSILVAMRHIAQSPFNLLKELWISFHGIATCAYISFDFPVLELLVVGQEPSTLHGLPLMLNPRKGVVPSPRIATVVARGQVHVANFANVLRARADAGCRLKTLRMKDRRGEYCLLPLEREVDELQLLDELDEIMELPETCKTDLGERWLSWRRDRPSPPAMT